MASVNPFTNSLQGVIDVIIEVSPAAAPRPSFNQALILGTSSHIPSQGTNSRIRQYTGLTAMTQDGFLDTDPEYLAAELYFGQSPAPTILWVGRQDLTALGTVAPTSGSAGTGYVVGDIITVTQAGASGGTCAVETVGTNGAVTSLAPVLGASGTGYMDGAALPTTGGTGSGLEVNITAIGESPLQALQVCRMINYSWYPSFACAAVKADHEAIAAWVQSVQPSTTYLYVTQDADALGGLSGNVFSVLKAANYNRALGQYSTFDNAVAAIMGYAMGQNTGVANSAYTLKFKQEVGVPTENLTSSQISTIEGNNGNLYLSYGNYYSWFEQGVMANGQFFDEIINLDMLGNNIQLSIADLLNQNPKIPQTDAGMTQLIHAANQALDQAVTVGFLAPGTWDGPPISQMNLNTGDMLPKGYLVTCPSIASQSQASRSARQAPPIYIAIVKAGAIHFATIQVNVSV